LTNTWRITPEVVRENQGITNFQYSRHNIWIQTKRDPKKEWLQLRYCVTGEEVQWAMKDWPKEWKVPVISKKVPKSKQKVEIGPSQHSTIPTTNTRKATEHTKGTRGSIITKSPRQKNTIPKASTQEKECAEEINGGA
jgi:hypothetical protein